MRDAKRMKTGEMSSRAKTPETAFLSWAPALDRMKDPPVLMAQYGTMVSGGLLLLAPCYQEGRWRLIITGQLRLALNYCALHYGARYYISAVSLSDPLNIN